MNSRLIQLGLALAMASVSASSSAVTLTFDGDAFANNNVDIPQNYGDRVTALIDAGNGFEYGTGGGFTPNIVVDYVPDAGELPFNMWSQGYGDLTNVLGNCCAGFGKVVLSADPGFLVTLNTFDVAPWAVDWLGSRVRILDGANNVLFDSGVFDAIFANGHYSFPGAGGVTASTLQIINTTGNNTQGFGYLGLDNVNFSQNPVPIPGALWLLGSALGGLGLARRKAA